MAGVKASTNSDAFLAGLADLMFRRSIACEVVSGFGASIGRHKGGTSNQAGNLRLSVTNLLLRRLVVGQVVPGRLPRVANLEGLTSNEPGNLGSHST